MERGKQVMWINTDGSSISKDMLHCVPKLAPSIVDHTMYADVKSKLPNAVGFFQWKQTGGAAGSGGGTNRCGADWTSAKNGQLCPGGTDGECPSGQKCFSGF